MPYILSDKRNELDVSIATLIDSLRQLESDDPDNDMGGNLNYTFTKILMTCFGTRYREMAQAVSVLEMAKLEYYRKVAAPYEDQKEFENGSVLGNDQLNLQQFESAWK